MAVGGENTPQPWSCEFSLANAFRVQRPGTDVGVLALGFWDSGDGLLLGGALLASLLVDCFLAFELPKGSRFPSLGLGLWASHTLCFSEFVPLRLLFPYFCTFKIC